MMRVKVCIWIRLDSKLEGGGAGRHMQGSAQGLAGLAESVLFHYHIPFTFSPEALPAPFSLLLSSTFYSSLLDSKKSQMNFPSKRAQPRAESRACSPYNYLTGPRRQQQPPAGNKTHKWFHQWPGSAEWEVTALTSGFPHSDRASWSTCLSQGWSEPAFRSLDPGTLLLFFVERRWRTESGQEAAAFVGHYQFSKPLFPGSFPL